MKWAWVRLETIQIMGEFISSLVLRGYMDFLLMFHVHSQNYVIMTILLESTSFDLHAWKKAYEYAIRCESDTER